MTDPLAPAGVEPANAEPSASTRPKVATRAMRAGGEPPAGPGRSRDGHQTLDRRPFRRLERAPRGTLALSERAPSRRRARRAAGTWSSYSAITISRALAAGRALRVAADLERAEALLERVVGEEAPDERFAEVEHELDGLERLDRTDDPGEHAEHAGLGARRRQLGRRRLGQQAAVARAVVGLEHRDLTLEPEDRPVHDGHALEERRVVQQVAGREVVGAVDDDVVAADDVDDVVGAEAHVVGDDVDVGVERGERLLRRVDLAVADALDVVQDLALQVRGVDDVHVDDAERADSRRREIQGRRRPEATRAEQEDLRLEQALLTGFAHLRQEDVAAVPDALLGREHRGRDPRPAFVLPASESARHRDDVRVAEVGESLGGERGAGTARAVDDDRDVAAGQLVLGLALEVAPRDEHRAGDHPLLELVELADVEERRASGGGARPRPDRSRRSGSWPGSAAHGNSAWSAPGKGDDRGKSLPADSGH